MQAVRLPVRTRALSVDIAAARRADILHAEAHTGEAPGSAAEEAAGDTAAMAAATVQVVAIVRAAATAAVAAMAVVGMDDKHGV